MKPSEYEPVRINRFIAQSGACSRREADKFVLAGRIKVNGKVISELGTKVIPAKDIVTLDGKKVQSEKFVYILLNKPKNTISTTKDPEGRRTVIDAIQHATQERIFPVGRLDRNTTGLLLLTNDGELTKRLTHPSHNISKLYNVRLDKDVPEEHLELLLAGIELEDGKARADKIAYVEGKHQNNVGIQVHIGKNRIVRRMFEHLGYKVEALDRVMIAHLTKKNLPRGKWRKLTAKEVNFLKMV